MKEVSFCFHKYMISSAYPVQGRDKYGHFFEGGFTIKNPRDIMALRRGSNFIIYNIVL